jgi:hypothetical protein
MQIQWLLFLDRLVNYFSKLKLRIDIDYDEIGVSNITNDKTWPQLRSKYSCTCVFTDNIILYFNKNNRQNCVHQISKI